MPEAEWAPRAELPPAFGPNAYDVPVCPGWLTRQPAVTEAMEAFAALEKGALAVAFPDIDQATYEGAMTAVRAFNARTAERMKEPK